MIIPVYDATFDPLLDKGSGIYCVSLVERPAIDSDFIKLSKEEKFEMVQFDRDKRIVTGAVLVPNKLIYRNDEYGERFIRFSSEVISDLHKNMMKGGDVNFSLNHNGINLYRELYPLEIWVKEYEQDKSNALGLDLPVGTLFMSAKIEDDDLWNRIKDGEFNGFSIEGFMSYKYANINMEKFLFEKIELGKQVIKQVGEDSDWNFSGEFENEGKTIVVESGLITKIKGEEPLSKQEETNESEEKQEPQEKTELEKLMEKIEQFSAQFESVTKDVSFLKEELLKKNEKEETEKERLLERIEEIKLSNQQKNPVETQNENETYDRLKVIETLGKISY